MALTSDDTLLTFDSARPGQILNAARVTGLDRGEDLLSIDTRPANGVVYGVTQFNQLYTINPTSGAAKKVGGSFAVDLRGRNINLDFNPTVDRLRLTGTSNQNLRINPNDGTVVDGNPAVAGIQGDTDLAYALGDPNQQRDPQIVGSAYTNNFLGTSTTTLFGLDAARDTLVRQGGANVPPGTPSPNGGQLFTIGSLGLQIGERAGFDIAPDGTAYAAFRTRNGFEPAQLATIDLSTGKATLVGKIGNGRLQIDGLTVLTREETVFAVTASNRLVTFRANDPGTLLSSIPISGLMMSEVITGIDVRVATGELFGLTSTNRIVRINPATGQAIQTGNPIDALFTAGPSAGFDFNHTVDRIRLVNGADNNLRFNPVTFAPVDGDAATAGVQPDTMLAYLMGDPNQAANPNVVAVAYDRADNDPTTATTLFGIDSTLNILVRQGAVDGNAADVAGGGSPNGGKLTTLGSLGVNPTDMVSFDISGNGFGGNGVALVTMQLEGESVSKLFTINLATGIATLVGTIAGGETIRAMAIALPSFQFSAPSYSVKEGAGVAVITVLRTGGSSGAAMVQFATSDGSAAGGTDYTPVVQTLMFADGETSKTITIPISNDRAREPNKTVNLTLSNPSGGAGMLGNQAAAVLTILNDDR